MIQINENKVDFVLDSPDKENMFVEINVQSKLNVAKRTKTYYDKLKKGDKNK